jgi:hypothetical protein
LEKRFLKQALNVFSILFTSVLIIISLVSCNFLDNSNQEWEMDKNSYIVGFDTSLYRAIDDDSNAETIEVGTLVEKTGKCRESQIKDDGILCPIKTVHSSRKGWIFEYALVEFDEYLPSNYE